MRSKKLIAIICAAVLLATVAFSTSASAKSIDLHSVSSDINNLAKIDAWGLTHPKELVQLIQQETEGNYDIINNYFTDPEVNQFFTKAINICTTVAIVEKTASVTINPSSTEKGVIPSTEIKGSNKGSKAAVPTKQQNSPVYSILTIRTDNMGKVNINPFLVYKDKDNNLVVWAVFNNNSQETIQINGLSYLELTSNKKIIAQGDPAPFKTPVTLASRSSTAKVNSGVKDGLPTMCFLKMTFHPGTYDDTVDYTDLDFVGCAFSLDSAVIQ